jgi:hypothetical protein
MVFLIPALSLKKNNNTVLPGGLEGWTCPGKPKKIITEHFCTVKKHAFLESS